MTDTLSKQALPQNQMSDQELLKICGLVALLEHLDERIPLQDQLKRHPNYEKLEAMVDGLDRVEDPQFVLKQWKLYLDSLG